MVITKIACNHLSLLAINEKALNVALFSFFISSVVQPSLHTFKLHQKHFLLVKWNPRIILYTGHFGLVTSVTFLFLQEL
jgi:hypothetical protein